MTEDDQLPIPKCSIALLFPTAVASFQCDQHKAFKATFMERLPAHCISHESGQGLISGRKAFQKPMKEGVELLNTIQDVYLDKTITVA